MSEALGAAGGDDPIPERVGAFEAYLAQKVRAAAAGPHAEAGSDRDPERIREEAAGIARTLARFATAVADAMESPRCAHDFLQRLDLRTISRDHEWRRIFAELADRSPCFDVHKRAVIVRYLQYLSERKRLVDQVLAHRTGLEETAEQPRAAAAAGGRLVPLGETVVLAVTPRRPGRIWLGSHGLEVHAGPDGPRLEGLSRPRELRPGRNLIGRHPECDVVLDPRWRDASRVHALLEWLPPQAAPPGAGGEEPALELHLTGLARETRLGALR